MKKIAIITVALMMTAPVTFALPAAADQLKVGTSVKLERDAQLPSCQKVVWFHRLYPPTPRRRPDHKSPQVEATTCRDPGSVNFPGFIFMAVNEPSEIIRGCCCAVTAI